MTKEKKWYAGFDTSEKPYKRITRWSTDQTKIRVKLAKGVGQGRDWVGEMKIMFTRSTTKPNDK